MDHVHFDLTIDVTIENNEVREAGDDSFSTKINKALQIFKSKIFHAFDIISNKNRKPPDVDTLYCYIMKTEAKKQKNF